MRTEDPREEKVSQVHHKELLQISLAINAELDLKDLLDMIVRSTRELTGCEDASIVLWCHREAYFKIGASTNIGPTVSGRVRQTGGASRWVVEHGRPVIVKDTRQDPFVANPMIPESRVLAYTGVPIKQGDNVRGVLYALYCRVHQTSSKELWVMEQAAAIAAAAIHNADLVDSLRDLNAFKSAMMQTLVHDLRNPLCSIAMVFELLQLEMDQPSPEFQKWFRAIQRQISRMEGLITSILNYEKINSVDDIERNQIDLNLLARDAVSDLKETAFQKSHGLILDLSSRPVRVYGNRVMLREAIDNLVINAIKYTPCGGSITVRTRRKDKDCVLEVQDTGPGIAPKDQKILFQPFVRLDSESQEKGSGLGLSLVKRILERHAGMVTIESSPGKGSGFSLHLPPFDEGD
jgi:signal transduction histidine kinase